MAPPPAAAMPSLPPGFRFHPTDAELITHYLANQSSSNPIPAPIIAEVNIYRSNPWELPAKALFGARDGEWFFFSPRDRKYPNGARPNRAAGDGYWKATGTDKPITAGDGSSSGAIVGVKKALVFYRGKPPRGVKTDWIMHEYRLASSSANGACKRRSSAGSAASMRLDDWVLCRIHKKSSNGSTNLHNFSSSSEHDHEQEESSTVEESSMNTTTTTNNNNTNMSSPKSEAFDGVNDEELQELRPMAIAKSCSITDLLNTVDYASLSHLLLDGAAETAACYDQLPAPGTETEESALIYTPPNPWQTLNCSNNNNNSSLLSYLNDDAIAVPQLAEQEYYYSSNGDQHLNGGAVKRKRSTSGSYCNQLHINGGLQAAGSPLNSSSSGFEYSGMLIHPFLMNNHQLQM